MATASKDDLEDLFQEALGDFLQPSTAAPSLQPVPATQPARPISNLTESQSPAASTSQPQTPAPTPVSTPAPQLAGQGKGLGLGAQLPGRGPKLPPPQQSATRAAPLHESPTQPTSLAGPQQTAVPATQAPNTQQPMGPKLPPHMQALADDIMGLLREAGGEGVGDTDDDDGDMDGGLKAMQEMLMSQLRMGGGDPGEMMGMASGSGGMPWDGLGGLMGGEGEEGQGEDLASDAVRGLMQRTKKTVEKQAKFARGEGAARGGGASNTGTGGGGGAGGSGNPFADLLGGLDASGGDGQDMLTTMLFKHMLLSKDMLYGPLKDIHAKYPPWIAQHADSLTQEELARYHAQQTSIEAVLAQYDKDADDTTKIMELVAEMQSHGQPPDDLVAELNSDLAGDLAGPPGTRGEGGPAEEDMNFEGLPPELLQNLPKELQKECTIM